MTRPAYILPVIIYSQFTGASLWFAGNAVILDLQRDWGLVEQSVGYVTAAVQIGFIAGTLVFAFFALAVGNCRSFNTGTQRWFDDACAGCRWAASAERSAI